MQMDRHTARRIERALKLQENKRVQLTDEERAIREIKQLLTETDGLEFTMNHSIKAVLQKNGLG
jgi:hypothetical protein